jgi:hypothetical protein
MTKEDVFDRITVERNYQDAKWGNEFDDKNTPSDWASFITYYATRSLLNNQYFDLDNYLSDIVKVAALAVAILEREKVAPRHWD